MTSCQADVANADRINPPTDIAVPMTVQVLRHFANSFVKPAKRNGIEQNVIP
jgi:hypothetical protein